MMATNRSYYPVRPEFVRYPGPSSAYYTHEGGVAPSPHAHVQDHCPSKATHPTDPTPSNRFTVPTDYNAETSYYQEHGLTKKKMKDLRTKIEKWRSKIPPSVQNRVRAHRFDREVAGGGGRLLTPEP